MLVQDFGLADNFGKLPTMLVWLLTASLLTCSSNCFPMVATSMHFTTYYVSFQQWANNLAITYHNSGIFKEILKHPFLTEGQTLPAWWQFPQIQQHRNLCPHKFPTVVTHVTILYFILYNTLSPFSHLGNVTDFTSSVAVRECLTTYPQPRVGNGIPACHPGNSYCSPPSQKNVVTKHEDNEQMSLLSSLIKQEQQEGPSSELHLLQWKAAVGTREVGVLTRRWSCSLCMKVLQPVLCVAVEAQRMEPICLNFQCGVAAASDKKFTAKNLQHGS